MVPACPHTRLHGPTHSAHIPPSHPPMTSPAAHVAGVCSRRSPRCRPKVSHYYGSRRRRPVAPCCGNDGICHGTCTALAPAASLTLAAVAAVHMRQACLHLLRACLRIYVKVRAVCTGACEQAETRLNCEQHETSLAGVGFEVILDTGNSKDTSASTLLAIASGIDARAANVSERASVCGDMC